MVYLFSPKTGIVTATILRRRHFAHPEDDRFAEIEPPRLPSN
jgi:hypothetical protein